KGGGLRPTFPHPDVPKGRSGPKTAATGVDRTESVTGPDAQAPGCPRLSSLLASCRRGTGGAGVWLAERCLSRAGSWRKGQGGSCRVANTGINLSLGDIHRTQGRGAPPSPLHPYSQLFPRWDLGTRLRLVG